MLATLITACGGVVTAGISAGVKIFQVLRGEKRETRIRNFWVRLAIIVVGVLFLAWCFYTLITQLIIKPKYEVTTNVYYSSGDDAEWAYSQNRKEFTLEKACYVRIDTGIIASNYRGTGKDVEIELVFSGSEVCDVVPMDASDLKVDYSSGKICYRYAIKTTGKNQEADLTTTIFKYVPQAAGDCTVKVIYDDRISSDDDVRSTISFVPQ